MLLDHQGSVNTRPRPQAADPTPYGKPAFGRLPTGLGKPATGFPQLHTLDDDDE